MEGGYGGEGVGGGCMGGHRGEWMGYVLIDLLLYIIQDYI